MSCPSSRGVSTASSGRRWFSRRLLTSGNDDIGGRPRNLPVPACQTRTGGQPGRHHRRDIFDAIRYVTDNACKWRALPADFRLTRPCSASSAVGPGPGSSTTSGMSFAAPSGCAPGAVPTRSPASSIPSGCVPRPPSPAAPAPTTLGRRCREASPGR
ncbi:transposase [Nonomuraea bangladeshensis]|uniref:transposase n=1 Tax=Nonomuraea bangladeshensis TaxID=404385 RepID=UPI003CD0BB1F